jgi:hypothetical protein
MKHVNDRFILELFTPCSVTYFVEFKIPTGPFKCVSCFWQSHVCMPNFLQVSYMYNRIVNLDYTQLHTVSFARTTLGNPGSVSGVSSASLFLGPSSATIILLVHPSLPALQSIPTLISFAKKVSGCTMCTHALDLPLITETAQVYAILKESILK